MPAVHPSFQCVVISPLGKLLDCQTISAVLPAHDGEVGIWYNHIPMLCKLGTGIMRITDVPPDVDTSPAVTCLLIDGGFALLAANVLTVTSLEAISPRDTKAEKIQRIIKGLEKSVAAALTPENRHHYTKKISLLKQLLQQYYPKEAIATISSEPSEIIEDA